MSIFCAFRKKVFETHKSLTEKLKINKIDSNQANIQFANVKPIANKDKDIESTESQSIVLDSNIKNKLEIEADVNETKQNDPNLSEFQYYEEELYLEEEEEDDRKIKRELIEIVENPLLETHQIKSPDLKELDQEAKNEKYNSSSKRKNYSNNCTEDLDEITIFRCVLCPKVYRSEIRYLDHV